MLKIFSKAKKLKIGDKIISLGLGFAAKPNKDGTISIFLKKKIKGSNSPITLLLGKFPFDKEKKFTIRVLNLQNFVHKYSS